MYIIEQLAAFTAESPNNAILFDEAHNKGITYAQLDDLSGRIYAFKGHHRKEQPVYLHD
jgi:hypothetical protein